MRLDRNLVTLFLTLMSVDYMECATAATSDCATLSNKLRFQKIYSRKKRYVVFPPGSAVIVSNSIISIMTLLSTAHLLH